MSTGSLPAALRAVLVLACVAASLSFRLPAHAATVRIHYRTAEGQSLSIRGSAPPLSWTSGLELPRSGDGVWTWQSPPGLGAFEFRPYLQDRDASTGANY